MSEFQELERFHSVDEAEDVEQFVHFLDLVSSMPWVRDLRALVAERLAVVTGDVVVDVGCGTGEVVSELSAVETVARAGAAGSWAAEQRRGGAEGRS